MPKGMWVPLGMQGQMGWNCRTVWQAWDRLCQEGFWDESWNQMSPEIHPGAVLERDSGSNQNLARQWFNKRLELSVLDSTPFSSCRVSILMCCVMSSAVGRMVPFSVGKQSKADRRSSFHWMRLTSQHWQNNTSIHMQKHRLNKRANQVTNGDWSHMVFNRQNSKGLRKHKEKKTFLFFLGWWNLFKLKKKKEGDWMESKDFEHPFCNLSSSPMHVS